MAEAHITFTHTSHIDHVSFCVLFSYKDFHPTPNFIDYFLSQTSVDLLFKSIWWMLKI